MPRLFFFALASASAIAAACAHSSSTTSVVPAGAPFTPQQHPGEPPEAPAKWLGLLGEYDTPSGMRVVLEDNQHLYFADTLRHRAALTETSANAFEISQDDSRAVFNRGTGTV